MWLKRVIVILRIYGLTNISWRHHYLQLWYSLRLLSIPLLLFLLLESCFLSWWRSGELHRPFYYLLWTIWTIELILQNRFIIRDDRRLTRKFGLNTIIQRCKIQYFKIDFRFRFRRFFFVNFVIFVWFLLDFILSASLGRNT